MWSYKNHSKKKEQTKPPNNEHAFYTSLCLAAGGWEKDIFRIGEKLLQDLSPLTFVFEVKVQVIIVTGVLWVRRAEMTESMKGKLKIFLLF